VFAPDQGADGLTIVPRLFLPLLTLSLAAARLPAQGGVQAHVDAIVVHDYRWRAIKRASGWNAQIEATARVGGARTGFAVGLWNNVELGTHRNGALTDLRAGRWGLSETNAWGELAHGFRGGDVAAGFIWYGYRGRNGQLGTGEVYGRFRGGGQNRRRISPEVSIWYDVVHRKSGYLEAAATAPVLALPFRGLGVLAYLAGTAGVALGEPERRPELAGTTFEKNGFTAAELSAGFRVHGEKSSGGVIVLAAFHLQLAKDAAVRRTWLTPPDDGCEVRGFVTLGVGIRWPAPRDR
jgi:hypothetical protein